MTLEEFNKLYKYKTDKDKFNFIDVWEIPEPSEDGFIYADCESYCRYLKENFDKFEEWYYYYCKLDGIGHCVLIKNTDVIDCNIRQIVSIDEYYMMFNVTELRPFTKFQVMSKIIVAQIFLLWRKFFK